MVNDGVYGVDYVVDEGLEVELADTVWAVKGVERHQRGVLKVLSEQRVSLSIWVRHIVDLKDPTQRELVDVMLVYCRGPPRPKSR